MNHYYKAIVPTVSAVKGSKIIITSTPNGANLFKDLVMGASLPEGHPDKNMYKLLKVYWHQVPEGKFEDGTEGTRLDVKLYPIPFDMQVHGFTTNKLIADLQGLGHKVVRELQATETGTKECIRVMHRENISDIESMRKLELGGVNIAKICGITNWREQETKLIEGEENFNQEYGIQFLAGSKRVLSPMKAKDLEERTQVYKHIKIESFEKKLKFPYNELRWAPDYVESERGKYYWLSMLDVSEGLGQDDSVINLFRLMVRSREWLAENKLKSMYDAFYLKQTAVYNFNRIDHKRELPELFYMLHFDYLNPDRAKSVVEYNGPGSAFLSEMKSVFGGNNNYGDFIMARFRHRLNDPKRYVGLKVSRNKKSLVKAFIDSVESDRLYVDENQTLDQMDNFIKVETRSGDFTYQADSGHDDLVMSSVDGCAFFETQDFKNMCYNYYNELPADVQTLIDKAMDLDYNPNAISYKGASAGLAKGRSSTGRTGRYSNGVGRFNK
jgi:hypothetical protein